MPEFRYQQLEHYLQQQIQSGLLKEGERLPSVRALCSEHSLSRATVLTALHRLEADQLITARPRSGYFVATRTAQGPTPSRVETPAEPSAVNMPDIFHDIMARSAAFDILPAGEVSDASAHLTRLNRMISRAARHNAGMKADYYDAPEGLYSLRLAISELYRQRQTLIAPEQLCITAGCQHALFLALMAVCRNGDTIAIESPAFYGVLQLAEQQGLHVLEISSDPETGIILDDLEDKLRNWPVAAVVVTPCFATPTGARMPQSEQQRLLRLADTYDFAVIEDDIYGELGFSACTAVPVRSYDDGSRVIICSSFSKSLSRDLRIGWIAAGRYHKQIVRLKLVTQLASPKSTQEGLAEFISAGHFRRTVNQLCSQLVSQRDALLYELKSRWGEQIKVTNPEGGLSCWVELPGQTDTTKAYREILDRGIILTPGALFSSRGLYRNNIRLSFAQPLTERRRSALHTLFGILLPE